MIIKNVGIPILPDCEPLDFSGPFEVFGSARAAAASDERLMNFFTVAESSDPIVCRYGLRVAVV